MFLLTKPSDEEVRRFIDSQREQPFSYPEVGATKGDPPVGYTVDHNRTKLGEGAEIFDCAVAAIKDWAQFNLGWVSMVPSGTELRVGAIAAILPRHFGFWSLNACRVIYLMEEVTPIRKFGFAYGTLEGHVERGEERFLIEGDPEDDCVWYDILAFSQPAKVVVKLGLPFARMLQHRFARDSMARMKSICARG
jgi:uncharacterized protein (UPF0548 family)